MKSIHWLLGLGLLVTVTWTAVHLRRSDAPASVPPEPMPSRTEEPWRTVPGREPDASVLMVPASPTAAGTEVHIFLPDGSLPASAEIVVHPPGDELAPFLWSPDHRHLVIPEGGADLSIRGPDHTTASGPVAANAPGPIVFHLVEPDGIRLTVTFPEGSEEVVHSTHLERIEPGDHPHLSRIDWDRVKVWSRRQTDALLLTDVEPGTYLVGISCRDHPEWIPEYPSGVIATTEVTVTGGIADAHIEVPLPDTEGAVLVTVYGPDGETRRSVNFDLCWGEGEPKPRGSATHRPYPGGHHVVRPHPFGSREPRRILSGEMRKPLFVLAHDAVLGPGRGRVVPGHPARAEIHYLRPGRISVSVDRFPEENYEWSLFADNSRFIFEIDGAGPPPFRTTLDLWEVGEHVISHVPPGEYQIRVRSVLCPVSLDPQRVQVREDRTTLVDLRLPELHPFSFIVADQDGFLGYLLHGGQYHYQSLGYPAGRQELPAGRYEITDHDRRVLVKFVVPRDRSVEIPDQD